MVLNSSDLNVSLTNNFTGQTSALLNMTHKLIAVNWSVGYNGDVLDR